MTITEWLLVITVAVWVVFDVVIGIYKGGMATISVTIWELSKRFPMIPLGVGILIGHIFVNMFGVDCPGK